MNYSLMVFITDSLILNPRTRNVCNCTYRCYYVKSNFKNPVEVKFLKILLRINQLYFLLLICCAIIDINKKN